MDLTFKGRAKKLDDIDLPKLGARLGVGEDEIHAFIDVETRGTGFDDKGRPIILFEPHIFHRRLKGENLKRAIAQGLAYPKQGQQPYPRESYTRLLRAITIDKTAALASASWGLGQVMGFNHVDAGYSDVQKMVEAFMDDEENHLAASVNFILKNKLDDELRRHDWAGFARGYNGAGYRVNRYDEKLADAFAKWSRIKDTKPMRDNVVTATDAVVLVDGPKKDETTLIVVQTPQNTPATPGLPMPATVKKTGVMALLAIIATTATAIGTAIAKYFGG